MVWGPRKLSRLNILGSLFKRSQYCLNKRLRACCAMITQNSQNPRLGRYLETAIGGEIVRAFVPPPCRQGSISPCSRCSIA
jgi:hypothetical protein